jgi:hypothetical protein
MDDATVSSLVSAIDSICSPSGGGGGTPVIAIPVNFRQVGGGTDIGNGVLYFEYTWDSSSGNPADLGHCEIGEKVTYPGPFPSPPWPPNLPTGNPIRHTLAATLRKLQDNHHKRGLRCGG